MGSGDSPGLQNRRAASLMLSVGSTPTRFRHVWVPSLRSGFRRAARTPRKRLNFKTGGRHLSMLSVGSTRTRFRHVWVPSLRSASRRAPQTPHTASISSAGSRCADARKTAQVTLGHSPLHVGNVAMQKRED
jgi:hypothetical protein